MRAQPSTQSAQASRDRIRRSPSLDVVLDSMSKFEKPRFHDEECYGLDVQSHPETMEPSREDNRVGDALSCEVLMESAQENFSKQNVKAGVDDIIAAYESLAQDRAKLAALRNLAFRELSTSNGWQAAPHPQALRLRRLTPSIPLRPPQ